MTITSTIIAPAGLCLACIYAVLHVYLRATQDRREPAAVETSLPFITPVIGLSKHTYFDFLRKRYSKLPIFTLRLPGQKLYVINDAQLIGAVQRQYKTLTFQAVEDGMGKRMFQLGPEAVARIQHLADEWRSGPAHAPSPGHEQFAAMAPGRRLDEMNQTMLKSLERGMESWVPERSGVLKTQLYDWVKEAIVVPTTDGVYGPANPYREGAVRQNYWTFLRGVPAMIKGGHWFVKDSVAAGDSLGKRFKEYFDQGGHEKFAGHANAAFKYYTDRGFPLELFSKLVSGSAVAVLGNTIPTAFWFLVHLYSDGKVFEACREEVLAQVVHTKSEDGSPVRSVDITAIKTACPLLNSAFKEVLRKEAIGTGVRGVEEDHVLDGKYLLRKGGLIMIPLAAQHLDRDRWGADAEEYCYDRFADKTRPRVGNNSFRSFGGGTTLCPGRHFVTTELLAFATMLLLRFDIVPTNGKWVVPTSLNAELTTTVPPPDFDVDVEIRKRADDEDVKWVWKLSESDHAVMGQDLDEHGNEKAK